MYNYVKHIHHLYLMRRKKYLHIIKLKNKKKGKKI